MHQRRLGAVMGRASPDELDDPSYRWSDGSPLVIVLARWPHPKAYCPSTVAPSGGFHRWLPREWDPAPQQRRPRFRLVKVGTHGVDMRRNNRLQTEPVVLCIVVVPWFRFDPVRVIPELTALSVLPRSLLTDRSCGHLSGDHNSLPLRWFPLEKANHEPVVKLTNCENLAQLVMGYGRRAPRRAVGWDVPRVLFG